MDNSQTPAYPVRRYDEDGQPYLDKRDGGMTKLEAFTMAAMQGLLSHPDTMGFINKVARENTTTPTTELGKISVEFAKATLAELSKHQ